MNVRFHVDAYQRGKKDGLCSHTTYGSWEGFQERKFCRPKTAQNGTLRNSLLQPPHVCSKTNISRSKEAIWLVQIATHMDRLRRGFSTISVLGDTSFINKWTVCSVCGLESGTGIIPFQTFNVNHRIMIHDSPVPYLLAALHSVVSGILLL